MRPIEERLLETVDQAARTLHEIKGGGPFDEEGECECREDVVAALIVELESVAHLGEPGSDDPLRLRMDQFARTLNRELLPCEPGRHAFRTTCERCGDAGMIFIAVLAPDERARIEPIPPVAFATDEPGEGEMAKP